MQFLAGLRPNKSTISRRDTSSTAEASHEGSGSRIPCIKGAATKAAQPKFPGNSRNAKLFAAELVLGEPQNLSRSHWQHFRSRICLAGTTRLSRPQENLAQSHSQQNSSQNHSQQNLSQNHSQQNQSRCLAGTTRKLTQGTWRDKHQPTRSRESVESFATRGQRNKVSQRSLQSAPIFRLLLKVAVKGTHQCDFTNFWGAFELQHNGTESCEADPVSSKEVAVLGRAWNVAQ